MSNAPTLEANSTIFASNLLTANPQDFVCYLMERPDLPTELWVKRLCGMAGDKIHIIRGQLYVNDVLFDKDIELNEPYKVSRAVSQKMIRDKIIPENQIMNSHADSVLVYITKSQLKPYMKATRFYRTESTPLIMEHFGQPWNEDNFGPVTVPKDHLFLLGDNRNLSVDSRHYGFVHKDNIKAVVISH